VTALDLLERVQLRNGLASPGQIAATERIVDPFQCLESFDQFVRGKAGIRPTGRGQRLVLFAIEELNRFDLVYLTVQIPDRQQHRTFLRATDQRFVELVTETDPRLDREQHETRIQRSALAIIRRKRRCGVRRSSDTARDDGS